MYFHPLQEEIGNLSDEEISKRIKDLSRKVNTARRFGRNPDMLAQLTNALNTYRNAIRERRIEEWHKNNKKLRGEPDLGDLVNID
jgi:hypothetical protein|tara:strand:- start:470 stop:724 length:255 start_codon:yes stop_codon:yes gene_type:complete